MIKKLVFSIISLSFSLNITLAAWYDGVGDTIATGIGGVIGGIGAGIITKNPWGVGAGAVAGGTMGQVIWNNIYDSIHGKDRIHGGASGTW